MIILYILLAVLVIALLWLASLPKNYTVSQSKVINVPTNKICDTVRDLSSWKNWNPWIIHEPDAMLEFSATTTEENSFYTWKGKFIGEGKLTNVAIEQDQRITQKLNFIKPFKSQADVEWLFQQTDEGTQVTWTMKSAMPFLFRPMIPMIKKMISMDYTIGLMRLDQHVNPKADVFQLVFSGKEQCKEISGISKNWQGSFDDIGAAMEAGLTELSTAAQENNLEIIAPPLATYSEVNVKKKHISCCMIIPTDTANLPEHLSSSQASSGLYFKVVYKGSYAYMKEAWYAAYAHVRMCKMKVDKKRSNYEIYQTDPQETPANETLTELYLPVKT